MDLSRKIISPAWLKKLKELYSEPHRAYHNLSHIEHMLKTLPQLQVELADPDAVELAIWFHDAIYDPKSPPGDNERRSADLLNEYHASTDSHKPSDASFKKAHDMILCTISHSLPEGNHDSNYGVFLDLDLSILSASTEEYDRYAVGIKMEYSHFDDETFRKGRAEVLRRLLGRGRLYFTEFGRGLWEENARRNMGREIEQLEAEKL